MISTIARDFKVDKNGVSFPMKEYPNWYGIEDIGFIYHGSWADPEIEYNGHVINAYIVEDTMWERFTEQFKEQGKDADECIDDFDDYMREHKDDVYELIKIAVAG